MKRITKLTLATSLAFGLVQLVGCASTTVTPTGAHTYAALPDSTEVSVFASEKDVGQAYETLGIVEYSDAGKYQNVTLEKALPHLKEKARLLGANGLIIDQSTQTKSGIWSRGIDTRARAIRILNTR